jgi:hypothetical protein
VVIDTGHLTTKINVKHPRKTSDEKREVTVTGTKEVSWMAGGGPSGSASQAFIPTTKLPASIGSFLFSLSLSWTQKDASTTAKTQILSRITQFQDQGVTSWGFLVDDPYDCEHGIELLDSDLLSVDFEYLGVRNQGPQKLPEYMEVEVAAYWSLPVSATWSFLETTSQHNVPPYFNLCQVVVLKIPRNMMESLNHEERHTTGVRSAELVAVKKPEVRLDSLEGVTAVSQGQDPRFIEESVLSFFCSRTPCKRKNEIHLQNRCGKSANLSYLTFDHHLWCLLKLVCVSSYPSPPKYAEFNIMPSSPVDDWCKIDQSGSIAGQSSQNQPGPEAYHLVKRQA